MDELQEYRDQTEIGTIDLSISPVYKTPGSYKIEIYDHNTPIITGGLHDGERDPACDETLEGLTPQEAAEFFDKVRKMIEGGSSIEMVSKMVSTCANKLEEAATEARGNEATQKRLRNEAQAQVLQASRFRGEETVNGINISVKWIGENYKQYEICFLQTGQVEIIGDSKEVAERVFRYAKIEAANVNNPAELHKKVSAFLPQINVGDRDIPVETHEGDKKSLGATRQEETINGIKILMTCSGGKLLRAYYLSFPEMNNALLSGRIKVEDGKIDVSMNPAKYFEMAKSFAAAGKSAEDIFSEISESAR